MGRCVALAPAALISALALVACGDDGGVLDAGTVEIAGTWSVQVTSSGSLLTDCQGVTLVPDPAGYRGILWQADAVGTVVVEQEERRLTIRPVVDAQPSGLTGTFSGDGSVVGSTIVAAIELELTDPGRPESDVQIESVRGTVTSPTTLRLTADRWTVDTGGCTIEPPVEYEIIIR